MTVPTVSAPRRLEVLDVPLDPHGLDALLEEYETGFVVFHNLDTLLKTTRDTSFRDVCRTADYSIVDGQVLSFLLRLLWRRAPGKASGSDFLPALCARDAATATTVFLLGAGPGVAAEAQARINDRVGRPMVVGAHSPSFGLLNDEVESQNVVDLINESGATTLAVGLGAPKQEIWIARHRHLLPRVDRTIAVGATLDFEAGRVQRAPAVMSRWGLEWLFRLFNEPRRLWRRYLWEGPQLAWALVRDRIHARRNGW